MKDSVFTIQARAAQFFSRHGTVPPAPQHNEPPAAYHRRMLGLAQSVARRDNIWADKNLHQQRDAALPAIERSLFGELPRNPGLTKLIDHNPETGRTVVRFVSDDPGACWNQFKPPRRLARFTNGVGRGADSERGRALESRKAAALKAAGL